MDPLSEILLHYHRHNSLSNSDSNFDSQSFYNHNRDHYVDSPSFSILSYDGFSVDQKHSRSSSENTSINQSMAISLYRGVNGVFPCLSTMANADDQEQETSLVQPRNGSRSAGTSRNYVPRGQWTAQEDRLLIELVHRYGTRKWTYIATKLQGRAGKQCRARWHNHLRPDIKKEAWSRKEEQILVDAHKEIGNKWSEIAKRLPGRSENSVKNHWNATKRRRLYKLTGRRRNASMKQRNSTLLESYVDSLIAMTPSSSSNATIHENDSHESSMATLAVGEDHEHTGSILEEEYDDQELTMILDSLVKTPETNYIDQDWNFLNC